MEEGFKMNEGKKRMNEQMNEGFKKLTNEWMKEKINK